MSKKELRKINQNHIFNAIKLAKKLELSPSSKYDLLFEGERFPPAEIIKIASKEANGTEISTPANIEFYMYLTELGFKVIIKETGELVGGNSKIVNAVTKDSTFPILKPDKRKNKLKVYNQCGQEACDKAVYEYLFKARDRKWIDKHIINKAVDYSWKDPVQAVFQFIGIKREHKGFFVGRNIKEAIGILEKQEHNVETIIQSLRRIMNQPIIKEKVMYFDNNINSTNDEEFEDYIYQKEIEALVNFNEKAFINDIPEAKSQKNDKSHSKGYKRNSKKGKNAIENAGYMCEIENNHKDFTSKATGKNYVEAHHLIPMEYQDSFDFSIDVEANIVSLCVSCHKKLHHAVFKEKEEIIKALYEKRKDRLSKCGIYISNEVLYSYYE
jgi:hypothetical protein